MPYAKKLNIANPAVLKKKSKFRVKVKLNTRWGMTP